EPAQLVVHERQELAGRVCVAVLDGRQDARNFSHRQHRMIHGPRRDNLSRLPRPAWESSPFGRVEPLAAPGSFHGRRAQSMSIAAAWPQVVAFSGTPVVAAVPRVGPDNASLHLSKDTLPSRPRPRAPSSAWPARSAPATTARSTAATIPLTRSRPT